MKLLLGHPLQKLLNSAPSEMMSFFGCNWWGSHWSDGRHDHVLNLRIWHQGNIIRKIELAISTSSLTFYPEIPFIAIWWSIYFGFSVVWFRIIKMPAKYSQQLLCSVEYVSVKPHPQWKFPLYWINLTWRGVNMLSQTGAACQGLGLVLFRVRGRMFCKHRHLLENWNLNTWAGHST